MPDAGGPTGYTLMLGGEGRDVRSRSLRTRLWVIIDTGVFGARLTSRGQSLASAYRPLLEGRPAVISFIAIAELRYGAKLAGWGTARLVRLDHELSRVGTI